MGIAARKQIETPKLFSVKKKPKTQRADRVDELASLCENVYAILLSSSASSLTDEESGEYLLYRERIRVICEALMTLDIDEPVSA
jgi:hypothetical protein